MTSGHVARVVEVVVVTSGHVARVVDAVRRCRAASRRRRA